MHRPILAGAIRAAALLAAMLTGIGLATATQAAQPDKARVIVTFKAGAGPGAKAAINAAGGRVAVDLPDVNAVGATSPPSRPSTIILPGATGRTSVNRMVVTEGEACTAAIHAYARVAAVVALRHPAERPDDDVRVRQSHEAVRAAADIGLQPPAGEFGRFRAHGRSLSPTPGSGQRAHASYHQHGHRRRVHERGRHRAEDGRRHRAAAAGSDE